MPTRIQFRQTRQILRSIHVPQANGSVRSVQVYEVVDVATHPQLRDAALRGELHRFESGDVLAIPFVYHDPAAKKLALVVPEQLRHEELRLRAAAGYGDESDVGGSFASQSAALLVGFAWFR